MPSSRRREWSWSIPHRFEASRALPALQHLIELSDDVGVIQHAIEDIPNRSTGYCTDDVARAFMVALAKLEIEPQDGVAERLVSVYLAYLNDAQIADGRFHNFMSYDRRWLDSVGTHDSVGRAMWSLGYGMRHAARGSWRRACKKIFDRGVGSLEWLQYPRSQAYAIIGLAHAAESSVADAETPLYRKVVRELTDALKARYLETRDGADWQWFENAMTYDNARLPEAMLRAGASLRDEDLTAIGLRTLEFYGRTTVEDGVFVPVGNRGWYHRGGSKARYCQQPLEAAALVDAALVAHDVTGDPAFRTMARIGLDWYYGRNTRGIVMARNGGCLDGLSEDSVNLNMGAESTLAYLAAAYALAARPASSLSVAR